MCSLFILMVPPLISTLLFLKVQYLKVTFYYSIEEDVYQMTSKTPPEYDAEEYTKVLDVTYKLVESEI